MMYTGRTLLGEANQAIPGESPNTILTNNGSKGEQTS